MIAIKKTIYKKYIIYTFFYIHVGNRANNPLNHGTFRLRNELTNANLYAKWTLYIPSSLRKPIIVQILCSHISAVGLLFLNKLMRLLSTAGKETKTRPYLAIDVEVFLWICAALGAGKGCMGAMRATQFHPAPLATVSGFPTTHVLPKSKHVCNDMSVSCKHTFCANLQPRKCYQLSNTRGCCWGWPLKCTPCVHETCAVAAISKKMGWSNERWKLPAWVRAGQSNCKTGCQTCKLQTQNWARVAKNFPSSLFVFHMLDPICSKHHKTVTWTNNGSPEPNERAFACRLHRQNVRQHAATHLGHSSNLFSTQKNAFYFMNCSIIGFSGGPLNPAHQGDKQPSKFKLGKFMLDTKVAVWKDVTGQPGNGHSGVPWWPMVPYPRSKQLAVAHPGFPCSPKHRANPMMCFSISTCFGGASARRGEFGYNSCRCLCPHQTSDTKKKL